jgi:hypothetical protein
MTETVIGLLLVLAVLTGTAGVLSSEWDHFQCSWAAFEMGHQQLTRSRTAAGPLASFISRGHRHPRVQVSENDSAVHAEAVCGGVKAQVDFPKLKDARW